jgi:hypothetical protein
MPKRASLDLVFNGKSAFDSRITFTRASAAWGTNSAGAIASFAVDAPRIDYDPVTLAVKGLLIEEARTRLNLVSLLPTIAENVTVAAVAHTISFYGTGTVTLTGVSTAGPLVGTGAYPQRVQLTFTPTAGALTITPSGSVNDLQLEVGGFASTIIRGEGTQVTRAADFATMTGANFSNWFNATEGTFVATGSSFSTANTSARIFGATDNTTANYIDSSRVGLSAQVRATVVVATVAQFNAINDSWPLDTVRTIANAYKLNDFAASLAGGTVATDVSGTIPTVDRLAIGALTTTSHFNGWIRRLTYYRTRLPNGTLQAVSA